MPFATNDASRALNQLNFALIRSLPYLLSNSQADFYTYDAKLNPAEYYASMPVPRLFLLDDIANRMGTITSAYSVTVISALLTDLESLDIKISAERSGTSGALIKADTLEWNPLMSRTEGMEMRRNELVDRLRMLLGLPPSPPVAACGVLGKS